jgi:hypothetical protein
VDQVRNAMSQQMVAPTKLSESLLWTLQRRFFNEQGVNAWRYGIVPHYITSNPFIARCYAKIVLAHLHDIKIEPNYPLYMIELGAGCGRFSFHFMTQFFELLQSSNLAHIKVIYIISDFVKANLDFCQNHAALLPFIIEGKLDFACFDAENDQAITLIKSRKKITAQTLNNPLIAIANYFFDCIKQDIFYYKDYQCYESLIQVSGLKPEALNNALPSDDMLENISIIYQNCPIIKDYYPHRLWNKLLSEYKMDLDHTTLQFPTGAFNCISNLTKLSANRLLLLMADRGYHRLEDFIANLKPELALQGCFSLPVNFHAIERFVEKLGGTTWHCKHDEDGLNISLAIINKPGLHFNYTRQSFVEEIINFGPADFFSIKKILEQQVHTLNPTHMLTYLRLSHWDAKIFLLMAPRLHNLLPNSPPFIQQQWREAIKLVWRLYYHIDEQHELALQISLLLAGIGFHNEAITFLREIETE